jgi:hypothetical protein
MARRGGIDGHAADWTAHARSVLRAIMMAAAMTAAAALRLAGGRVFGGTHQISPSGP